MSAINVGSLKVELQQTKDDCLASLSSIDSIATYLGVHELSSEYRKIAVPMIYSAWESFFTSSIAICFRALKDINQLANQHSPSIRAVWLQQESFFNRYIDMIKNIYDIDAHKSLEEKMSNMKKKVKKGHYKLTTEVLQKIDTFNSTSLDRNVNVDDLVMTFSNVNKVVTTMNMEVIGLDPENLGLEQLDGLVGLRNAFGHGEFTTSIGIRKFNELLIYTRTLIGQLSSEVVSWLDALEIKAKESIRSKWAPLNQYELTSFNIS